MPMIQRYVCTDVMSIGKAAEGILGPRAKTLLHLIIFFGIGLAMGVFVFVIGKLFSVVNVTCQELE